MKRSKKKTDRDIVAECVDFLRADLVWSSDVEVFRAQIALFLSAELKRGPSKWAVRIAEAIMSEEPVAQAA